MIRFEIKDHGKIGYVKNGIMIPKDWVKKEGGIMRCVDKSGQPRSNEELGEALSQVENSIVKDMVKIPPALAMQLTTIREALIELIQIRKLL